MLRRRTLGGSETRRDSTNASAVWNPLVLLIAVLAGGGVSAAEPTPEALDSYNVVWETPSANYGGSLPLGNGDIGLNVWVEPNGDLLFYIAKVDALDSRQVGRKLGRIRWRLDPPLPLDRFRQTLSLRDASVLVEAGGVQLRVWVDAKGRCAGPGHQATGRL